MKRVLKWLGIGIACVIGAAILLLLSGYLLPVEVVLEVEQTLEAPPEVLFPLFTTFDGVDRWWRQAVRDMGDDFDVAHLGGPQEGAGMELGFGAPGGPPLERWTYTAVEPSVRVEIDVDFQIFTSHRVLVLTPAGSGTSVRWRETAQVDSPIWRWMLKLSAASAVENRNMALIAAGTVANQGVVLSPRFRWMGPEPRDSRRREAFVGSLLNRRPRETLSWRTPAEALNDVLFSVQQGRVATTP